jgi:hypothetical protein
MKLLTRNKFYIVLLIAFLFSLSPLYAQKERKRRKNKEETAWNAYYATAGVVEVRTAFPFPFQEKKEEGRLGNITYVSAWDSVNNTSYVLHYTFHKAPLAKIEPYNLAQSVFTTFELASDASLIRQDTFFFSKEIWGEKGELLDKNKGMVYEYRTFVYGILQFQLLVAHPYYVRQEELYEEFFNQLKVEE